ncbi:MAG: TetR/AcrR family transcriptional regulator [Candidatus Latescibacteria bacterium]|nr:TetR/AcrR family transcriptional regulator [Candidatus Latescibacterota bacterium]
MHADLGHYLAMARRYDMRTRLRQVEATRAEIVAAAHALLDGDKSHSLTLDEVARAAGVSRATVYNQFGSRRQLLAAVFEDQGRLIRYDRVQAAMALPDPRAALAEGLRELARAWSSRPKAIRRVLALAVVDPEIAELVARYERYRRAEIAALAGRLDDAGLLGHGVSTSEAAAILGALTGFSVFDALAFESGKRAALQRLVHTVFSSLGVDPQPK